MLFIFLIILWKPKELLVKDLVLHYITNIINYDSNYSSNYYSNSYLKDEIDNLQKEGNLAELRFDYLIALKKFQLALEKAKKSTNKAATGDISIRIGLMYEVLGDTTTALDYYQQALAIYKKLNYKHHANKDSFENRDRIINILNHIGRKFHLDDPQKALDYHQQALAISKEFGSKHDIVNSLMNIGKVYKFSLDDFPKALEYAQQAYAQQALVTLQLTDDKRDTMNLIKIAKVYSFINDHFKALEYLKQALAITTQEINKTSQKINKQDMEMLEQILRKMQKKDGSSLTKQAKLLANQGKFNKQDIDILITILNKKNILTLILSNIGITYNKLGKYQKAKDTFKKILVMSESEYKYLPHIQLTLTEAKLNQPEFAIKGFESILERIEKTRNLLTKEYKIPYMRNSIFWYDKLITILQSSHSLQADKGYDRKAFETFERKQGRVFLEEMGQSGARRFTGLDSEIIETEQSLAMKRQNAQFLSLKEYTALEQAEEHLKKRIKAEYFKYYTLKYSQLVDLVTLQNHLLQEGEMILVYDVIPKFTSTDEEIQTDLKSQTILWVIGKQYFQMFDLSVDEDTLKQRVAQLRFLFNPKYKNKFLQTSHNLYQTLLPEAVRKLIKNAEILYIVPTGPLYGLPFGSLVTSSPEQPIRYLIEDYATSYLSSASLLKILRTEEELKTQPPEPFLAFADPKYPSCNTISNVITKIITQLRSKTETIAQLRTKSYLKWIKGGCFTRLAATADEVREIANLFNAEHNKALYLGAKASRSTVLALNKADKLDDYRYLMFSVHGIIPNKANQIAQPALVLSNPSTEGYLTMADAFTLKLNADFVNLSACNTGCTTKDCSENVRGEGIMGLTRAFMYAGTSRVAVTLWAVDLYSAKELNIGLFTNLKAKKKMAYALRDIKLKMIRGQASRQEYAHPYHWAGFVVYGDGQ
jgi:CHAT domain-containing protein